eukprot:scaffold10281_cov90-Isochrysis_galbana.AAC.1
MSAVTLVCPLCGIQRSRPGTSYAPAPPPPGSSSSSEMGWSCTAESDAAGMPAEARTTCLLERNNIVRRQEAVRIWKQPNLESGRPSSARPLHLPPCRDERARGGRWRMTSRRLWRSWWP